MKILKVWNHLILGEHVLKIVILNIRWKSVKTDMFGLYNLTFYIYDIFSSNKLFV